MRAVLETLTTLATFVGMLILELILAIFIYTYLALMHQDTFGWLARISQDVLDSIVVWMELLLPTLTNRVYATTLGEIGPKAMLLLLTGLTAGALFRLIVWSIVGIYNRRYEN